MPRITIANLKARTEELGLLREKIQDLRTSERELSEEVRLAMQARGGKPLASEHFLANLAVKRSLYIDPAVFRKTFGPKLFGKCARIDIKEARRHVEAPRLLAIGEYSSTTSLTTARRIAKVAGPARTPARRKESA